MTRIRFFIDPRKSDEEIANAILSMAVENGMTVPDDDSSQPEVVTDESVEDTEKSDVR